MLFIHSLTWLGKRNPVWVTFGEHRLRDRPKTLTKQTHTLLAMMARWLAQCCGLIDDELEVDNA